MDSSFERHPKNSQGPFYVVNGACISCGAPELEAPRLMSHDDRGHCYFVRQPESPKEVDEAIRATWGSCCRAVRYGSKDAEIIRKLAILDSYDSCDEKLNSEPSEIIRGFARFEFTGSVPGADAQSRTEQVLRLLEAGLISKHRTSSNFRIWGSSGSFHLRFGATNVICFQVQHDNGDRWIAATRDNDIAKIGFTLALERVLKNVEWFRNVEWFHDKDGVICGNPAASPYE